MAPREASDSGVGEVVRPLVGGAHEPLTTLREFARWTSAPSHPFPFLVKVVPDTRKGRPRHT